MPTRNVVLSDHQHELVEELQAVAQQGWSDIDAGRYIDLSDSELDHFIAGLGQQAASRAATKA